MEPRNFVDKALVEVCYHGRVQGVGFRYTTLSVASRFQVSGFVRNEPDGSVFLSAEGSRDELTSFLAAIRESGLSRYILDEHVCWRDFTGLYQGFVIAR